ncbi:helix-turn-helix transcriptional regulator [Maritalea sp.]|uniref:helix-turn-helix transcriptional regulator n=1 Tax=Maritalea sp. TaxID=2003361 RepID=UPI003EF84DFE
MNTNIQTAHLILGKHQFGRIDERMKIGPVILHVYDLFWVHQGDVRISFPTLGRTLDLSAPDGVLILPETQFSGRATGPFATASVCHFQYSGPCAPAFKARGIYKVRFDENLHVHNQVRLAMELAQKDDDRLMSRQQRLLHSILDGFESPTERSNAHKATPKHWLEAVWIQVADHLQGIRTLNDVARIAGVSESGLRRQHRAIFETSAGEYLRILRLSKAETLLATTGFSISEVAMQVGYRHAETFCTAFKTSRGMTPGQFRRWSKPFA